eukprot:407412_1
MQKESLLWTDLASPYSENIYNSDFHILPVYKLIVIVISSAIWHLLYMKATRYYTKIEDMRKREAIVSLCHSTCASLLSFYVLSYHHSLFVVPSSYSEPIQFCDIVFSISYGYFLWDLYISFATG